MVKGKEFTVISTFAGCGGSSLGYKWAGFKELLAIDFDKNAVETFRLNFDCPIWQRDIKEVTGQEILDFTGLKKGELDVLDGSPPCQGFSTAGKRQVSDDRNQLFNEFKRLIIELQPKVFVMENVSGMMKGKMKGMFNQILSELQETGYGVKCKLMNAKWYEVPQSRERLIFVGVRSDVDIEVVFPESVGKVITVKEAWKGIENKDFARPLATVGGKVWDAIRMGQNGSAYRKNYYFNSTKLHLNKPSATLQKNVSGIGGMLHPMEKRTITIQEAQRLQSFPDGFKFIGSFADRYGRIGNSVPPQMMYHIAKTLREEILEKL